jgi:hypothetical protein
MAPNIAQPMVSLQELGGVGNNQFDNAPILQKALNQGYVNIYIPKGYWAFLSPIRIPPSSGVSILGCGNAYSILSCRIPSGNENRGFIEYFADKNGFSWGLVLEHLSIMGNGSRCHCIYLKQIAAPLLTDLNIEGFDGAGLLLDKCQDGEFRNLNVQLCGRTSGKRSSLADRANVQKTQHSAIHLVNTSSPGDGNNMLRFNALQCENNITSPYIYTQLGVGNGPIGIMFSQVHGEVRETREAGVFEFFRADGGDFYFDAIALVGFKEGAGFTFTGYGQTHFTNSRYLNGVRHIQPGVRAGFSLSTCVTGDLSWTGLGGGMKVSTCNVGNVVIDYPGAGFNCFSACEIGSVLIKNAGGPAYGVNITSCSIGSLTTSAASTNGIFAFNRIRETLSVEGAGHQFLYNTVLGKSSIDRSRNRYLSLASEGEYPSSIHPVALDPTLCSLPELTEQPASYNRQEIQKMANLINQMRTLLNAEISRRKNLEACLSALNLPGLS